MSEPLSEAARVLGERVRAERLRLNLSQEEVAHLAGINVSNYGKVERGLSNPTFHMLVRLASVFGIDPGDLVRGIRFEQLPAGPTRYTAIDYVREREARKA